MTTIEVTKRDIDTGVPCVTSRCPIAIAIKRLLKPECTIQVHSSFVDIQHDCEVYVRALPMVARALIESVDNRRRPVPVTFELEIPEECLLATHLAEVVTA